MADEAAWTTLTVLNWTKDYLLSKGVVNARLEAEWLLCAATGLDRVGLYLQYDRPLNAVELAGYRALIARRAKREPLQHILGTQEFHGLEYEVNNNVLIPRHDTEILISEAILRRPDARTVLDIGTGSGCIAVTLQKRLVNAVVTATDISSAALGVARRNAKKHGSDIEFIQGSLFTPVSARSFDLIVSNPPYIPSKDIEALDPEVRDYDPRTALDGGKDGLAIYRELIPASVDYLNPEGWLLLEIGAGQADDIVQLFQNSGCFSEPLITVDSSGIERVIAARKEIS